MTSLTSAARCIQPFKRRLKNMETPEIWFHRRATHYVEAQILFHLNQAGVFQALMHREHCTAAEVAKTLDLDPAVTDALLDYVLGVDDLLDRNDAGQYSLSAFGEQVMARYSDSESDKEGRSINMFDVRVGAYGPVWQKLGAMLKREARHGIDFQRDGRFAENAVTKIARHFVGAICEAIDHLQVGTALEVGTTTGLLGQLSECRPSLELYGLDKNQYALDVTKEALHLAPCDVRLVHADFLSVSDWVENINSDRPGLIFSLHFHEILAQGIERMVEALAELRRRLPGWVVLALEQPRAPRSEQSTSKETLWLYGQSNILIHHLIGNGRILSREEWVNLGNLAGCSKVTEKSCNYLGYKAFAFHL